MAIVSSTFTAEGAQIDGRHWVREEHIGSDGSVFLMAYLAPPGADHAAILAAHAAQLLDDLARDEIAALLA